MISGAPFDTHPLLRALEVVDGALDDAAVLDPAFLPTRDKAAALLAVDRELARLEGLRLRLVGAAGDVADDVGARSAGAWLALESRTDPSAGVRLQRQAELLARWPAVPEALAGGSVNPAQAEVIARALDALPDDLDAELVSKAEAQLLSEAGHFRPRELRVLGRRVLEVVAPDVADDHEARALEAEERRGRAEARLTFRPRGDGVTDVIARLPGHVADRLRAYLDAFTSPRRAHLASGDVGALSLPRRRAEAFCALVEHEPTDALPVHGGTATSVVVTIDHEVLCPGVGAARLSTGGRISATEARRLACTAGILPAVLGGAGEVLDLGRMRRLFSPAQRRALELRDRHCRETDCDIPAAWCEAHHLTPWAELGRPDLRAGVLLCSYHHHRAHDPRWRAARLPDGRVRFTRRT